jgi:hypothetical protein
MKHLSLKLLTLFLLHVPCLAGTLYVDTEAGNDANDGSSFALRKLSITSASAVASPGDVIRVMASADPVSVGDATWTHLNSVLTLASSRTVDLYTDGLWTAATNVTCSVSSTRREGASSSVNAIVAAFTTGLVSYYTVSSTDLSAYQQLSFALRASSATADASIYTVKLCSDTNGAVPIASVALPSQRLVANLWTPIKIDFGGAIGAGVQSIALYATTDPGTTTLFIDNVFATNDIALTGHLRKGSEPWWVARSINGANIILDHGPNSLANSVPRGYVGTTETTTTYYQEPIKTPSVAAATNDIYTISSSGTSGNVITISGGWNRTDMTTQTGYTHLSGFNNTGEMFGAAARDFFAIEKFVISHCGTAIAVSSTCNDTSYSDIYTVACSSWGISLSPTAGNNQSRHTATNIFCIQGGSGFGFNTTGKFTLTNITTYSNLGAGFVSSAALCSSVENIDSRNNTTYGISLTNADGINFKLAASKNNGSVGIYLSGATNCRFENVETSSNNLGLSFAGSQNNSFFNITSDSNNTGSFSATTPSSTENYFYNWTRGEATALTTIVDLQDSTFFSVDENGTDSHRIYTDNGLISSDATTRHTASGISWKLAPTSTVRSVEYPLVQRIGAVPVKGGVEHTATVWMRRDNTDVEGEFVMKGYQLAGLGADSVQSISAGADTWEQLSIVFTPTVDGFVEFRARAYGGSTYSVYWDDFAVSAASAIDASSGDYGWLRTGVLVAPTVGVGAVGQKSSIIGR